MAGKPLDSTPPYRGVFLCLLFSYAERQRLIQPKRKAVKNGTAIYILDFILPTDYNYFSLRYRSIEINPYIYTIKHVH